MIVENALAPNDVRHLQAELQDWLSLESLWDYCFEVWTNGQGHNVQGRQGPSVNVYTVQDLDLFKLFLPPALLKPLLADMGPHGYFLLTFVLRHQLSLMQVQLQLELARLRLQSCGQEHQWPRIYKTAQQGLSKSEFASLWKELGLLVCRDIGKKKHEMLYVKPLERLYHDRGWQPFLSYSALGCHLLTYSMQGQNSRNSPLLGDNKEVDYRKELYCLFFDPYANQVQPCPASLPSAASLEEINSIEDVLFCREHTQELWWQSTCSSGGKKEQRMLTKGLSPSAQMGSYYLNFQNLFETTEEDLHAMLEKFWKKFFEQGPSDKRSSFEGARSHARNGKDASETDVIEALSFFHYQHTDELCAEGSAELKRRYKSQARRLHPDTGGSHESFSRLHLCYRVLQRVVMRSATGSDR